MRLIKTSLAGLVLTGILAMMSAAAFARGGGGGHGGGGGGHGFGGRGDSTFVFSAEGAIQNSLGQAKGRSSARSAALGGRKKKRKR